MEDMEEVPPPQTHPGQVPIPPVQQIQQMQQGMQPTNTFADELFAVQPYINNLFMLLVLGMLYDIRQAALDCKMYMVKHSM